DKAAGELRTRVRARFVELGRRDRARDLDAAWISTFHGLCARILRAHAVRAGLDPAFAVMEEADARDVRATAFEQALAGFLADAPPALAALEAAAFKPGNTKALQSDACTAYLAALDVFAGAWRDTLAAGAVVLLDELLGRYADVYGAAKRARAALDFDDLELL